jgi:pyruvate dehydrogenase E1 component
MIDDKRPNSDLEAAETQEWLESLDYVVKQGGAERVRDLLISLQIRARQDGIELPFTANTPYVNTIPPGDQQPYPGSREIERRIKSIVRWNAMAMVVRANKASEGIGGHISTFASSATLYEVAWNHFFRGKDHPSGGDIVFFQGHAAPGMYARAYVEGRLSSDKLHNFRHELADGGGLSSYPHPWLMPDFWEFPTVSMGLGPIQSIYQARFMRYLEDRGLKAETDQKVWAFLGDGETDEPESLGAISLAARENLDNLIWVVNCNLQRLDGPVRGNGNIVQELERNFRGAGWNVIKVLWGGDWDPLIENDEDGKLTRLMTETVDGEYQNFAVRGGEYIRKNFFGTDPDLAKMAEPYSDEQLAKLRLGGHDPNKVYAAYSAAIKHTGQPTVILARTIKGYGMGEAGEGRNITHGQKKLNDDEMRSFRTRFGIPISDDEIHEAPFYRPPDDDPSIQYVQDRREALGGYIPERRERAEALEAPGDALFEEFYKGTGERSVSTTMAFVRMLTKLVRDKDIGKLVVPIVPDEARTFGMEALFRQIGIYSHVGQLYDPVDSDTLLYYKEAQDGQIFEEGITEAGSLSSFIAAGTAYANFGVNTIPFFIFYSMFGFQRVGDLIWAAGDIRAKGFLLGGTAGRTTLAGEGLQHQDGNSHLLAYPMPNMLAYDPAFAYEIAIIIKDGIRRMYQEGESVFYYLTVGNENYTQPPMPDRKDVRDGIIRGLYKFKPTELEDASDKPKANLFGSGAIMNECLKAQDILEEQFGVATDVYSITSFKELYRDGIEAERWNMLHPSEEPQVPYISSYLKDEAGVFVIATDYVKALPNSVSRWFPSTPVSLGTDGFGRSEARAELRDFFEVDARYIVISALTKLMQVGEIEKDVVQKAIADFGINVDKPDPMTV